jgi:hypothetical protein
MMAVNSVIEPNMPRLETVKVPPWYSRGWSLPSRALPARVRPRAEMVASPLELTSGIMGVIRPVGVATAREISALVYL